MIKIYCDHCGKEIHEKEDYVEYEFEFERGIYPCDLCATCKNSIEKEIIEKLESFIGGQEKKDEQGNSN